jgi:hypothetical protein
MLRRVTLVRTDVSVEPSACFIRVASIGGLCTSGHEQPTHAAKKNQKPHGVTSQKTPFFIVAVKSSKFTPVCVKNGVFWDVRVALVRADVSEELSATFIRAAMVFFRSVRRLLVTASVVPSSPILVTLIKEALSSSEMSVLARAIRRTIPADAILHSHRRENLKSYKILVYHQLDRAMIKKTVWE